MERKALFFDIDGTLLSEITKEIPQSAKDALKRARQKGHLVFINSGRSYILVKPIMEEVEADGCLCGCGTSIVINGEFAYAYHIPHERGNEIKRSLLAHEMDGVLEGAEGCYFRRENSWIPFMERLRRSVAKQGAMSTYFWEDDCYEYDKFCAVADESSDREGFFDEIRKDFTIIDRGDDFYECVPQGHSKATAIEWVLNHYGLSLEDAWVFGDSRNDLPMFEYAKHCVLMGKHDPELEAYATFQTKDVEEDGIAWAMEKLGII